MSRTRKHTLLILAALAGLLVLVIALFDWNMLRGYAERKIAENTGRPASIGHLDVDLSLNPRIKLRDVRLGNAPWGKEEWMLDAEVFEVSIELLPLLRGRTILQEVFLSRGKLVLEKDEDGRRNWVLKRDPKPDDQPPVLYRLRVAQGQVTYRDPAIDTDMTATFSTDSAAADQNRAMHFEAQGTYKGQKSRAKGSSGGVLALQRQEEPFPVEAEITVGATRAKVSGTVTGLSPLTELNLALDLRGASLSHLFPLIGTALPDTPPYRIAGQLSHAENLWDFREFSGKVGDSDLAGSVRFDRRSERPKLSGELRSKLLDFDDLAGFIGGTPAAGAGETASAAQKRQAARRQGGERVLPDAQFRLGRLRAMDADVNLTVERIRREGLPLDDLKIHFLLDDGVLKLDPLNFGVAGGNVVSRITLNGQKEALAADARINFNKLRLDRLFPNVELTRTSVGSVSGRAELTGNGNSFAQLLASADGDIAAVVAGGQVSNLLLEFAGIDGAEIIKFLLGGDRNARLRCAVADFKIDDGLMQTEVFVFDTTDTNIIGEGTINLQNEQLELTLTPLPKDKSILSGRSPLHVTGTFKDPAFAPDMGVLAARGGAALVLGALAGPLAALLPLVETGPGRDSDCAGLIELATRDVSSKKGGKK